MTAFERIRSKSSDKNMVVVSETTHADGYPSEFQTHEFSSRRSWREIHDFKTKVKVGGRFPATPCLDHGFNVHLAEGPWETTWGVRGLPVYWSDSTFAIDDLSGRLLSAFVEDQLGSLTEQLAQDAYDAFCTQVPTETSIANFAIEADDLGSLIPKLGRSLRETSGNLFLGLSFGSLPFIGDLEAFAGIVQRVLAKIERLKALNGKNSRLSFSRDNLYAIPALAPSFEIGEFDLRLKSAQARFTASARLYADIDRLEGLEGIARAVFADLGLNNPLQVVWNALPFSFVLDWVLRFSNVLGRFAVNPYTGVWLVDDLNWSIKTTSTWDIFQDRWRNPFPFNVPYEAHCGQVFTTRYVRNIGLPTSVNYFTVPPTAGQAALGVALLSALTNHR